MRSCIVHPLAMFTCVFALAACVSASPPAAHAQIERPSDGVLLHLHAGGHDAWTLRSREGKYVCTLPCDAWVGARSGHALHIEKYGGDGAELPPVPLPDELPARSGESLDVRVDRKHGMGSGAKWLSAPLGVVFGLGGVASTGIGIAGLVAPDKHASTSSGTNVCTGNTASQACTGTETRTEGTAASISATVIGVALLGISTACWIWFAHDRDGGLEFSPRTSGQGPRIDGSGAIVF